METELFCSFSVSFFTVAAYVTELYDARVITLLSLHAELIPEG